MRTDIKVIILVVAVVIAVVGIWLAVYYRPASRAPAPPPAELARHGPEETNVVEGPPGEPGALVESPYAGTTVRPPVTTPPAPGPDLGHLEIPSSLVPPATTPPAPAEQTYLVQRGDTYPLIALRYYRSRALAYLIERANPNVPPSRLAPGLTIRIPPLLTATRPVLEGPPALGPAAATMVPGATSVDAVSGKRYYVVKQGDQGFWGVAQAVYGDGKYGKLIEDANPGVKSTALRPGQKLWAPERPAPGPIETAVRPPARLAPGPTTAPSPVRARTGAPMRETIGGRTFD